ncbi:non-structural maintenance of chromosomes element 1 homolog [Diorhabda carinulata]|uniref:non-structural maintenance of chromosomes element 1 homolog n=1 Tax=Diorhabda carinulata TaxID=1163345 RepID=UPI0025A2F0C4|nr:non-structural maintenance of chromosomes element 1 homolog [Diorhabda carinulata]
MDQINDNHRYFIQYMLKNGAVTVEDAQKYCQYVSQGEINNITQLKTLVIEANREISNQCYKIVFNICEVTNKNYLVWLNTKNDDISRLQITFSALELEYFHAIVQEILLSEERRITFIVCINITSTLTSFLSRDNGQKVLNKWIKGGYFINKSDYIYLGPRLILEFTSYLKVHLPDSICTLCSELVFWGDVCESCQKINHSHCLGKYLKKHNNCPHCSANWTSTRRSDDKNSLNENEDDQNSRMSNSNDHNSDNSHDNISTPVEKRRYSSRNITSMEDDDSSDDDPNVPGPSTRKRHK